MLGCDIRSLDAFSLRLLSNRSLIAVNQDPLGIQAACIGAHRNVEIWTKALADGSIAVGFFNLGNGEGKGTPVGWRPLGLPETARCRVTSLLTGEDRGIWTRSTNAGKLEPHGCDIIRIELLRD